MKHIQKQNTYGNKIYIEKQYIQIYMIETYIMMRYYDRIYTKIEYI